MPSYQQMLNHLNRRRAKVYAQLAVACLTVAQSTRADDADLARSLAELPAFHKVCMPTQVGFWGDTITVVGTADFIENEGVTRPRTVFYKRGGEPWRASSLLLNGAHSVTGLPNGHWLINDTDNNRLIEVDELSGKGHSLVRSKLGGYPLSRPHDQIVDPETGDIYVIDGNRRLFRFKQLEGHVDVWSFSAKELGYARALSWFDNHLHVINSSRGEILRIDDYARRKYTVFRSPRSARYRAHADTPFLDYSAGALGTTGLVLNDVEKAGDWYYGTNFFTPVFALGGESNSARLIRWRSWDDFQRGEWEDLSDLIPSGAGTPLIPYFLTLHGGTLYTTLFEYEEPDWHTACATKSDQIFVVPIDAIPARH